MKPPSDLKQAASAATKARHWLTRRDDAIRAAVAAGASLREVAGAVGLSHVGVAKIVRR